MYVTRPEKTTTQTTPIHIMVSISYFVGVIATKSIVILVNAAYVATEYYEDIKLLFKI